MKILNFGSLNLDYIYSVDHFLRPGETLASRALEVRPGGKGLNQSIALARAGAEDVFHAGLYGAGGEALPRLLRENGVDTRFLLSTDALQGNAVIEVAPSGENRILLFGGSNRAITREQIAETLDFFGPGDLLLLQNEINLLAEIVDRAFQKGLRIVLNPSPCDEALETVDFGKLSWLFVNEIEAEALAGSADPNKAFAALHEKYPALSLLVTLGADGSCAFCVSDSGVERRFEPAAPANAVDTTAAGDTYTGYFLAALLRGEPLSAAMNLASRAAALSVSSPGAADSIPLLERLRRPD
jgi:ribokinase